MLSNSKSSVAASNRPTKRASLLLVRVYAVLLAIVCRAGSHTLNAVRQDCVRLPGTRRATRRAGRYQRGPLWPVLLAQRERRAPVSESAASLTCTTAHLVYAKEHCCRASKISGTEQSAAHSASSDDLMPPEELLLTLQAACRTDTTGGMHFGEVARSLRCPPPSCAKQHSTNSKAPQEPVQAGAGSSRADQLRACVTEVTAFLMSRSSPSSSGGLPPLPMPTPGVLPGTFA